MPEENLREANEINETAEAAPVVPVVAVVLAAGFGTRFDPDNPKQLVSVSSVRRRCERSAQSAR